MSWFDSSFSLARQALSQAQKSIDRVLDIQDGPREDGGALVSDRADTGSAGTAPHTKLTPDLVTKATDSGPTRTTTSSSAKLSLSHPHPKGVAAAAESNTPGKGADSPNTSSSSSIFGSSLSSSTWATGDSFWNAYFTAGGKESAPATGSAGRGDRVPSDAKQQSAKTTPSTGSSAKKKAPTAAAARPKANGSSSSTTQLSSTPPGKERPKKMASPMVLQSPKLTSTPVGSHEKGSKSVRNVVEESGKEGGRQAATSVPQETVTSSLQPSDKDLSVKSIGEDEVDLEGVTAVAVLMESTHQQDTPTGPHQPPTTPTNILETVDGTTTLSTHTVRPTNEMETSISLDYITYASPALAGHRDQQLVGVASREHTDSEGTPTHGTAEDETAPAGRVEGLGASPPLSSGYTDEKPHSLPERGSEGLVSEVVTVMAEDRGDELCSPEGTGEGPLGSPAPPSSSDSISPPPAASGKISPSPQELEEHPPLSPEPLSGVVSPNSVSISVSPSPSPAGPREEAPVRLDQDDVSSGGGVSAESRSHDQHTENPAPTLTTPPTSQDTSPPISPESQPLPSLEQSEREHSAQSARVDTPPDPGAEAPRISSDHGSSAEASSGPQEELERLRKELGRVSQLLEVRESKMLEMSKETIELMEANQTLQMQLSEAHESLQTGQSDAEDIRSEFTRRLGVTEKKLQTVIKERDSLRKQLQVLQTEQTQQKRTAEQELSELLREKEEQVAGLMEEGEKLSKQQLTSSNAIKKLRQKVKENDQLLGAQRQQIEDCEAEMRRLKEVVRKKEDNEKKYQESLGQLNTIAEQQSKELTALKRERDDLSDKVRSLQANLDSSYREMAELQKANAVNQSAAQGAALEAERGAREELMRVVEQQRLEAQQEKETLILQLNELRTSLSRAEQQAAWREDHLRQEVADVQQRLQEAEGRNQDLTSTIAQATKPLLRQIDNLQTAHSTQAANWERVEASLTQRLVEAQTQLASSTEKERNAVEKELALQSRVGVLETHLSSVRQEKSQLLASLELERAKVETLEEGQLRESTKIEALRSSYQQSMEDLRKEKEMLERQLEYERVRLEAESRKASLESQEKERLRSQLANSISSLSRTVSRQSSTTSTQSQSEILEKSLVSGEWDVKMFPDGRDGTARLPSTSASVVEHLQSLVKQKEGELTNTRSLVDSLERSRAAMAKDLATVSAEKESLSQEVQFISPLRERVQEVEHKYEALLQMYGEKAEEAEELRLDIQDLKAMYRQQIDQLLSGMR